MGTLRSADRFEPSRPLQAALVVGFALLGLGALAFSRGSTVAWLADLSDQRARVDGAITDVDVTYERAKQALVLTAGVDAGVATPEVAAGLVEDLERRADRVETISTLDGTLTGEFADRLRDYAAALEDGDLAAARRILSGEVGPVRDELMGALRVEQGAIARDLGEADSLAGTLVTLTGGLLVFVVPLVMLAVHRGVTRRQLRQAEQRMREEAAEDLDRSRAQFLAGLSHELRTPLTGILGLANLLGDRYRLDPDTEDELVGMLQSQAGDLSRMVDDLIVTARSQAEELSFALGPVPVAPTVEEAAALLGDDRGRVLIQVDPPEATVVADPLRLRHALHNLLDNARRHGGPAISVIGRPDGSSYRLEVRDDGPGLAPAVEERLFERYVHEADAPLTTGTVGLGLSVTRLLVEGMGGGVSYERSGGSTRFVLHLVGSMPAVRRSPERAVAT